MPPRQFAARAGMSWATRPPARRGQSEDDCLPEQGGCRQSLARPGQGRRGRRGGGPGVVTVGRTRARAMPVFGTKLNLTELHRHGGPLWLGLSVTRAAPSRGRGPNLKCSLSCNSRVTASRGRPAPVARANGRFT